MMNIQRIARNVRRAIRRSNAHQLTIDRNNSALRDPAAESRRILKVRNAAHGLRQCNIVLGSVLYYAADHNIPTGDNPNPTPYKDVLLRTKIRHERQAQKLSLAA